MEVEITADTDNLDSKGNYAVTFTAKRGSQNKYEGDITLLVAAEKNVCVEGKGQTADKGVQYAKQMNSTDKHCFTTQRDQYIQLTLNQSNGYKQTITVSSAQKKPVACGSFQTNVWILEINGSTNFTTANSQNNTSLQRSTKYIFNYKGKKYPKAVYAGTSASIFTDKNVSQCNINAIQTSPSVSLSPTQRIIKAIQTVVSPTTIKTSPTLTTYPTSTPKPSPLPSPTLTITPTTTPRPTITPSKIPTLTPTTIAPTITNTPYPTATITPSPTSVPTAAPTLTPTSAPTVSVSPKAKGPLTELPRAGAETELMLSFIPLASLGIFLRKINS